MAGSSPKIVAGTGTGGRNIGVAVDLSPCSKNALRWAAANLAAPGDRLILIHVKTSFQYEQGVAHLWEHDGSPLIPLVDLWDPRVGNIYGVALDRETMELLAWAAAQRGVHVLAKVMWGDPARRLTEAVHKLHLHCIVLGNRGLSTVKRVLMGSVSTYVVNHAACPATVVRENMLPSALTTTY